jgi:phosphate transport system ATP-binding protein
MTEITPHDATREPILQIRNLSAYFSENKVLHSVNLDVQEKEILALIGPSGCGKSTLLRNLNRLHEENSKAHSEGEIIFHKTNILDPDLDLVLLRQKIGMVFQKPSPFPQMSIYENVIIGPRLTGRVPKSRLHELAELCLKSAALWDEVKDKLKSPATSLSGGQQQRLCVARALATSPEILLMDEPTSALDPIATEKIEELIKNLSKSITVVLVTHNMLQARRIAHRTAFMHLGELIEVGHTQRLFEKPNEKKTAEYLGGKFG